MRGGFQPAVVLVPRDGLRFVCWTLLQLHEELPQLQATVEPVDQQGDGQREEQVRGHQDEDQLWRRVAVADQLVDRLGQRQAAHHRGSTLAQRREDPVALLERRDGADGRGLLAEDRAVEADAALALPLR